MTNVGGEWDIIGIGGDWEVEPGLDLGSVVVLEERRGVGDVLGFKPTLSSGVHEVSLACDVE